MEDKYFSLHPTGYHAVKRINYLHLTHHCRQAWCTRVYGSPTCHSQVLMLDVIHIYKQTPTIDPSILPGIVSVGCWQACRCVGGQVNVGCKLQQRDVVLQRPWESYKYTLDIIQIHLGYHTNTHNVVLQRPWEVLVNVFVLNFKMYFLNFLNVFDLGKL